ncbi:MAG: DUF4124 domain-containing protein [Deltaproteobacteria bacterium]|nr:DUF4124 domain-containing protein [Deltaproteobacteria bacterium]
MKRIAITFLMMLLLSLPLSAASLYRWVDEQGNTHVTDSPPPAGSSAVSAHHVKPTDSSEVKKAERQREYDSRMGDAAQKVSNARWEELERTRLELEKAKADLPAARLERERLWEEYSRAQNSKKRSRAKASLDRLDRRIERMEAITRGH